MIVSIRMKLGTMILIIRCHFNELSHNVSALHFLGNDTIDLPQGGNMNKKNFANFFGSIPWILYNL